MTLAAKSLSSCSSGSTDECTTYIEKQIEEDIEEEIKEEIKKEHKEETEEEIEEEIEKAIKEEIKRLSEEEVEEEIKRQSEEEVEEELKEEIEEETEEENEEETEEEIEEEIEKAIKEEIKRLSEEEVEEEEIKRAIKEEIKRQSEEEVERELKEEIEEETEEENELQEQRNKRIKVTDESTDEEIKSETVEVDGETSDAGNVRCSHPVVIKHLCSHCGEVVKEARSSVALQYIHKDLRVEASEIEKLRQEFMKDLLKNKKLILVLDLDFTLLNSARFDDLILEEAYLLDNLEEEDDMNQTLYMIKPYHMLTKLRPFVHTFLKEANDFFEMYIYTMGERGYADKCAKLLDPKGVYFPSRVICKSDNTTMNQKGLDVVIGSENLVIILDDTEEVWQKHKENLILMKRYYFFAHGARHYNTGSESLLEEIEDERESDGILASILNVLKRAHKLFFDPEIQIDLPTRDVRKILQLMKMEILQDCDIVFSNVFASKVWPREQPLWKFAESMGTRCFNSLTDSVTHVVAKVPTTGRVKWARENNKFVVTPQWIEEANYTWQRQKEEDYPVLDKNDPTSILGFP